jgi:hypothetical protein
MSQTRRQSDGTTKCAGRFSKNIVPLSIATFPHLQEIVAIADERRSNGTHESVIEKEIVYKL